MLRWGILGTGFISHKMIEAVQASNGSSLHTIAGRKPDQVAEFQSKYDFPHISIGYDDVLADPDVDAVYIGLPNHIHHVLTKAAAEAGKAVLSEKSLTTTMAEADMLLTSVKEQRTFFAEGLMYLSHPLYARLTEILNDGRLGALRSVSGRYAADIWQVTNPAGRGTLYNLGCYPASLLHYVVQAMCGDSAFVDRSLVGQGILSAKDGTISDASVLVKFANGVLATLQSTESYGMAHDFAIMGDRGVLRFVTNPWLPVAGSNHMQWCPYEGEMDDIYVDDPFDAFYYQVKMVENAVATGATEAPRPSPRLLDSYEIMGFLTEWEACCRA